MIFRVSATRMVKSDRWQHEEPVPHFYLEAATQAEACKVARAELARLSKAALQVTLSLSSPG